VSSDGRWLLFTGLSGMAGGDSMIWRLRIDGGAAAGGGSDSAKPEPMLATSDRLVDGQISPDGRAMAYSSAISGRQEIYVMPFPGPGGSQQVSVDGGFEPLWSRDGRALFFQNGDSLMEVEVTAGAPPRTAGTMPRFGRPRPLYQGRFRRSANGNTPWSVSPDGQRFIRVQQAQPDAPIDRIDVVLGWGGEVARGAGVTR
jgi:hypothetical protein